MVVGAGAWADARCFLVEQEYLACGADTVGG